MKYEVVSIDDIPRVGRRTGELSRAFLDETPVGKVLKVTVKDENEARRAVVSIYAIARSHGYRMTYRSVRTDDGIELYMVKSNGTGAN